jgi:hypothetical protein
VRCKHENARPVALRGFAILSFLFEYPGKGWKASIDTAFGAVSGPSQTTTGHGKLAFSDCCDDLAGTPLWQRKK